jgi:uridine kinase
MIGVCGGSGSGKTTLAHRLAEALGPDQATCVSFDSYYRDYSQLTVEQRARVNFDHPDSLDVDLLVNHLQQLKAGHEVAVPVYDFATHTRSDHIEMVQPRPFVLIEGILLFAFEEIRHHLDHLIFRHCPDEVRAARRFERDVKERGRTPESVKAQWAETVLPMHRRYVEPFAEYADVVTTHGQDLDEVVAGLAKQLVVGEQLRSVG